MSAEQKILCAKRDSLKKLVKSISDYGKEAVKNQEDSTSRTQFLLGIQTIDQVISELRGFIETINTNQLLVDDEFVPDFTDLEDTYTLMNKIRYFESKLWPKASSSANDTTGVSDRLSSVARPPARVQLPALELPKFNGDVQHFPVFYHSFKSMIHENPDLTNDQRVQYLVSRLYDKALSIISGVPAVGSNYDHIWDTLVKKYLDQRVVSAFHIDQILNFKPVKFDNAVQFSSFVDKYCSSVECLRSLKLEDLGEVMLCHLGVSKLDYELRRLFESSLKPEDIPTAKHLIDFLQNQSKIINRIQTIENKLPVRNPTANTSKPFNQARITHSFVAKEKVGCELCHKDRHPLYKCERFLNWSVTNRHDYVKKKSLCFNCLSQYHKIDNCPSKSVCFKCSSKHNTLLHFDKVSGSQTMVTKTSEQPHCSKVQTATENNSSGTLSCCSTNKEGQVFLSTVKVQAMDSSGKMHDLRLLLDTGSETNFLVEEVVKKLGLQVCRVPSSVNGIGAITSPVKGKVNFKFFSKLDKKVNFNVPALVINTIAENIPSQPVNESSLAHLKNIIFSDDEFNTSKPVVGILGASMFAVLLEPGKIVGPPNTPSAINTLLGYTILGGSLLSNCEKVNNFFVYNNPLVDTLESQVQKFMELEDIPAPNLMKPEDIECETLFEKSFRRGSDGRFMVSLPFKESPEVLGLSYNVAKKRFFAEEKKLMKSNKGLHLQFSEVMQEFLSKGYMSLVNNDNIYEGYYIPVHCISKQDSTSFKLRPVFDGSCKTTSGISLNDILHTGPKLYNDLIFILLSFRLFQVALMTDIKKMYLQILVQQDDRKFQKILFRSSPTEPLQSYTLNTVTFGLTPSPYLALKCVQELTKQEAQKFPLACERVRTDSYMDDVCSSVPSEESAVQLQQELIGLFKSGGFELSKWASNSKAVLCNVPNENKIQNCIEWDNDVSLKVLGLKWNPVNDVFVFQVNVTERLCTKRNVLKLTASIFDVLGLLTPVTLYAKLFIKKLWSIKLDWDDAPPTELQEMWVKFQCELKLLEGMSFSRHIGISPSYEVILVGTCDASQVAYGCNIYARVQSPSGDVTVSLICGKSKLSPMTSPSLPRLELCGLVLLSKLMKLVLKTYEPRVEISKFYCLSDSKVTIDWVKSPAYRWNTFVANRVAKIHENVGKDCFHHIPGIENPSDCASRGLTPSQFLNYQIWQTGPKWLTKPINFWPLDKDTSSVSEDVEMEEKKQAFITVKASAPSILITLAQRFSSWSKLLHTIVYILRMLKLLPTRESKIMLASDLQEAESRMLKAIQLECFSQEINNINNNQLCSSQFQKLNPFMHNGLILVGGRLSNSALGYDQKHQVLLPSKHHVTTLIVDYYHKLNLHSGPHLLLSILRQRYWILGGRNVVRLRVQKCNHCFKMKPLASSALMGELPACRVNESRPFVHTGTDFTGSLRITLGKRRGVVSQKAYICLFICLVTKAVHLELVVNASTEGFMNAFKRFLSRRGAVSVMYSDNGTNYIGARNELDEIYSVIHSSEFKQTLGEELEKRKIQWSFIPPLSPHMGGIWESNIKQMKRLLFSSIGLTILTFEEMYTVLTMVEALLNSRPLCPLSSDPNDIQVLTPAHFLHANPLQEFPAVSTMSIPENRLSRYQLLDNLVQTYWKRWSREYLNNLQVRTKWNTPQNPIKVGQVIIIKCDSSPPLHWPLGLVTDVFPGQDGVVRVVQVRTATGSYKRPVTRLCPLPSQ